MQIISKSVLNTRNFLDKRNCRSLKYKEVKGGFHKYYLDKPQPLGKQTKI